MVRLEISSKSSWINGGEKRYPLTCSRLLQMNTAAVYSLSIAVWRRWVVLDGFGDGSVCGGRVGVKLWRDQIGKMFSSLSASLWFSTLPSFGDPPAAGRWVTPPMLFFFFFIICEEEPRGVFGVGWREEKGGGIPHRHRRVFTRWPAFSNKSGPLIAVNPRCLIHCICARQGKSRMWLSCNMTWSCAHACPCVQSLNSTYIREIKPNKTLRWSYIVHSPEGRSFPLLA